MWCVYTHTHTHTHTYKHIHTHNGIILNLKKNKILDFAATWMDLETVILRNRERNI